MTPEEIPVAVREAAARVDPHIRRTPVERSTVLDPVSGEVWLKLECLQRTGSFKLRGATNKILSLSDAERADGVVTASSGNHGIAVASAAGRLGVPVRVYVPEGSDRKKIEAIAALGAEVIVDGEDFVVAEAAARADGLRTGAAYVSAYNDPVVVAGQGTVGLELAEQVPALDAVFVAVGGGGLISGIAGTLKPLNPGLRAVACSPANSPVLHRSMQEGRIVELESLPTLSDGTAGGLEPGAITLGLCQALVDDSLLVTEAEIAAAMRLVLEHHELAIEGAAGVAVAGWLKRRGRYEGKKVAIILCGAGWASSAARGEGEKPREGTDPG